jgi:acyl-CoA hydrolase
MAGSFAPPYPERMIEVIDSLELAVDRLLARIPGPLHVGAPLGLGKPHRLLNALYGRVERDPSRQLHLYTALSLDVPEGASDLERRFLAPFVARFYGDEASGHPFPRLDYVAAQKRDALPANIVVEEFYLQSGALLGSAQAQRNYASLNYTHVAHALADRGVNCIVQKVAANADGTRLSLSSNTDLTFDAVDAIVAAGLPRPVLVAEIDPRLPWLDGVAAVDVDWFDLVVAPPPPYPLLFGLPRQPVGDADYAIGLYASALVRDGGTLQIGIGALSDALCHALVLRHTDNATYRRVLQALDPVLESHPAVAASGGLDPLAEGLYGCSEMINEGFKRLVESGVMRRKVVEKESLMQRVVEDSASDLDLELLERDGEFLHGAFYLGSPEFYDWLRNLDDDTRHGIGMRRVSEVNELYGGNETLERLQRRHARFFNTCMMATALGAAVSDALEDGRVVSGVGGQYNFVAMAHALPDARSVLLLRAARDAGGKPASNIRWNYGHTTIPRHLRDIYISEYGIADLRGRTDEDCVIAMAAIADARFAPALVATAQGNGKLCKDFAAPDAWARNTPQGLRDALAPFRGDGTLPDYPLGSDFTGVEQRLVRALQWLKAHTSSRGDKLLTVAFALFSAGASDDEAMQRMSLDKPGSVGEWIYTKLLRHALARSSAHLNPL